jgi:dTDP-4-dehydrorhamnose reductase
MRIIIVGGSGLLGTAFRIAAGDTPGIGELLLPGRRELDVRDQTEVERYITATSPDIVINAAVLLPADLCESHPQAAYELHALGARWVSRACARVGALPVYISTDFVFDGRDQVVCRPDTPTGPLLTYGITKLAGELETRMGSPRHLVIRTAGLFGPKPDSPRARPCFVHRILEQAAAGRSLSVVDSVVMSPTFTIDLARMTLALAIGESASGTYHIVNEGAASWHELAVAAVQYAGYDCTVDREVQQSHVAVPRPVYTPLAGDLPAHVASFQRPWRDALGEYIKRYWIAPRRSAA